MRVVIDRIEGKTAVIEVKGGGNMFLPIDSLPKGSREGSILEVSFRLNLEAEKAQREKIKHIQERLRKRAGH